MVPLLKSRYIVLTSYFTDPVLIGSYAPITAKYVFKKELLFLFPFVFVAAWIVGRMWKARKF